MRRRDKRLCGDLLAGGDIGARGFEDDLARDRRDVLAVRVATPRHPVAHQILVEAFRTLAFGETLLVAFEKPITAAVGSVDLVGKKKPAFLVEAELVFGVGKDEAPFARHLPPAREESKGAARNLLPQWARKKALLEDARAVERLVMSVLARLCRRRDEGLRQLFVFSQTVGKAVAVHLPSPSFVKGPKRGRRASGKVIAHHDLDRQDLDPAAKKDIGIGAFDHVVGGEIGARLEPEKGELGQNQAFERDRRQNPVERAQAVGGDQKAPPARKIVIVAHLAAAAPRKLGDRRLP